MAQRSQERTVVQESGACCFGPSLAPWSRMCSSASLSLSCLHCRVRAMRSCAFSTSCWRTAPQKKPESPGQVKHPGTVGSELDRMNPPIFRFPQAGPGALSLCHCLGKGTRKVPGKGLVAPGLAQNTWHSPGAMLSTLLAWALLERKGVVSAETSWDKKRTSGC